MKRDLWAGVQSGSGLRQGREALYAMLDQAAVTAGIPPSAMIRLLDSPTPELLNRLFTAARSQRERHFGTRVYLYGTLNISTHCRQRCSFCYFRKTNRLARRYRQPLPQVVDQARCLAASGVHLINLTGGEDPFFFDDGLHGFDPLVEMVRAVSTDTGLPVMISMGVLPGAVMPRLHAAGAVWYACYQETYNRQRFGQLRVGQDFDQRYQSKMTARQNGLLVEDGVLCGAGETSRDLLDAFTAMARLGASQVRATTFVPLVGTPMHDEAPSSSLRTSIAIALLRITYPDLLIAAPLDWGGMADLRDHLNAGANVVAGLVTPGSDAGELPMVRSEQRTMEGIACTLRGCGLAPASADTYRDRVLRHSPIETRKVSGEVFS
ncbi:radical SAM protein [Desulfosarcina ovata]|uniref:Methylornithine synthase PylB n=1 Tax=Desulfosarcina ovata subsp. ovata TaxID=2752305 RepID=A0A5K8A493_9BACT|nr:radical SAM protein [Desulfosarcina ovata]BBO87246.1 methylornithine synthase PylB [Desulfosarcina ovata subsp. ovata]